MFRPFTFSAVTLLLLSLFSPTFADRVQYEFTFDATWNPDTHPGFPTNGHFSGVYGTTHNADFTFWQAGELSSPGMQQIAEIGTNTIALAEVAIAKQDGSALIEIGAPGRSLAPYTVTSQFSAFLTHPFVSAATMIAPSPDWFVGVSDLSLVDERGNWIPEISVELHPYDAGTDSGINFTSENEVTDPFQPIAQITEFPFEGLPPLGTFTFRLLSIPGDLDGSGQVDAGDFETLCFRLGQSQPLIDQAGDPELIELDDVHALAQRVLGTQVGDANLDGKVGFDDFLTLSGNFGASTSWDGGDFDCNRQVEFADFLALSQNFGFDNGASVAAVPEPASRVILCLGLLAVRAARRRPGLASPL